MKALIEKNTWSGIEEYYRHMGESVWNFKYEWHMEKWLLVFTGSLSRKTALQELFLVLSMVMLKWHCHVWSWAPRTVSGWRLYIYVTPSFIPTESELLQNEVSLVTAGEAMGAESKTPPSLRRRKRTCSRRLGDKEKDRELGGAAGGDRADRGVREHRDRREASKSTETPCCCVCLFCFFHFSAVLPLRWNIMSINTN